MDVKKLIAAFAGLWVCRTLILATSANAAMPSFSCEKPLSRVETEICGNELLAQADSELSHDFSDLIRLSLPERRQVFVSGQNRWLKLRDKACLYEGVNIEQSSLVGCLSSVYRERNAELIEYISIIKRYKMLGIENPAYKIDDTLDKIEDFGDTKGEVYFDSDQMYHRDLNTCREIYTLFSGLWRAWPGRAGALDQEIRQLKCKENFYTLQSYRTINDPSKSEFKNLEKYSEEWEIVTRWTQDVAVPSPISFVDAANRGELQIQRDLESGISIEMASKRTYSFHLHNSKNCCGSKIKIIEVGDFTDTNRTEALIEDFETGSGSGWQDALVVAYFDPATNSIRPLETRMKNIELETCAHLISCD